MDPRALLRPVGPLPAGVYWRRRLLVVVVVALVAYGIAMAAGGGGKPADATQRTSPAAHSHASSGSRAGAAPANPQPAVSPTRRVAVGVAPHGPDGTAAATSSSSPHVSTARAIRACGAGDLSLTVSSDHTSYASDQLPRFVLTVRNSSAGRCRADVGVGSRSFVVVSGVDRIWSSADCATATPTLVTLRPGQRISYATTWQRHRSAPGCSTAAIDMAALPGTYRVTGRVGRLVSAPAVFTLVGS